jgi:hypothetical protein
MNIFYFHPISFTTTRYATDSYGRGEGVKDKNSKLCGGASFPLYAILLARKYHYLKTMLTFAV